MPLLESGGFHAFNSAIYSERRVTSCFHVSYMAAQSTAWEIEGTSTLEVSSGQFSLIQPNLYHRGEWGHDRPNAHFWFYFDPKHPQAHLNTVFSQQYLKEAIRVLEASGNLSFTGGPLIKPCSAVLYQKLLVDKSGQDLIAIRVLINQIFQELIEVLKQQQSSLNTLDSKIMLEEIAQKLEIWRNVGDIAEHFGQDLEPFQYFFKRTTGMSPWNYVLHQRCKRACERLLDPRASITQLAYDLGFSSSQHFSTTFKQLIGVPPKVFRSNLGSEMQDKSEGKVLWEMPKIYSKLAIQD